jgi:hypothetical protein
MPLYEVSGRTTLVTASAMAALAAIRGATSRPAYLRELHIFGIAAPTTSGALGLCFSTALGTGTLTQVTPIARFRNVGAPEARLVTAWATLAPTNGGVGTVFRRWSQSANIGNGVIWTFDQDPIEIPLGNTATGELCIVNLQGTAPGTFDITAVLEE